MINPEIGFTSDVIKDPKRFVGRQKLVRDCIRALNTPLNLIGVYGKRGVGKSSLARQIQQMALGDYTLARLSGLSHEVPQNPRRYLTVFYTCDSLIEDTKDLLSRLLNDQNEEDGLLRLVPDDGKELVEFTRSDGTDIGVDLKLVKWGVKGLEATKYAKVVDSNTVQTFRNFVEAIITHQVKNKMKRDGLLIILDEFDVIENKEKLGSIIKSLSSDKVKFAICGIGNDLMDLVQDHNSVERLLEDGTIHVGKMDFRESEKIIEKAEELFNYEIKFDADVTKEISKYSQGYPYMVQLIGKECVNKANTFNSKRVDMHTFQQVLIDIKHGRAFPTLESKYQRAVGNSDGRKQLLYLLASQDESDFLFHEEMGRIELKNVRKEAEEFKIDYLDQLIPRLIDKKYGPTLVRNEEKQGVYEFVNPIFRVYCQLREIN